MWYVRQYDRDIQKGQGDMNIDKILMGIIIILSIYIYCYHLSDQSIPMLQLNYFVNESM